jgi:hypothetical protein
MATIPTATSTTAAAPALRDVHLYSAAVRTTAALLISLSAASLPAMLVLIVLATDPPVTPPILARWFALFAVLPYLLTRLLRRAAAAAVEPGPSELTVCGRGLRLEIPYQSIRRIVPWAVPLPGPGLDLVMRSGRRLRWGLEIDDPTRLLAALSDVNGVAAAARAALPHPTVVYAHAKRTVPMRRWYHLVGKFPLFALAPTAVLFNAHQHIAHGGLLGEYYQLGLASYLTTFAIYWATVAIYLVLYASLWRGLAEAVALLDARVAPQRAVTVRRGLEGMCRIGYYVGVPVLLLLRFLP